MKIHHLKLLSSNFEKQFDFYTQTLGLDLIEKNDSSFSIAIGNSELTFVRDPNFHPYHFAINIPSYSENDALNFIKERTEILKHENAEIIDYQNWNAKALYFYDADKNLVELISRINLAYPKLEIFDSSSFMELSEIGLPTENIEKEFRELNSICGLTIYDGDFERFCAIGDETGLFICINKKLKKWLPTNERAYPSHFQMIMEEKGKFFDLEFNGNLTISKNPAL